jgi:hypothetical protein
MNRSRFTAPGSALLLGRRALVALLLPMLGVACAPIDDSTQDQAEDPGDSIAAEIKHGPRATVEPGSSGRLVYTADPQGDTIPDFSNVGYHGGGVALPDVPVVRSVTASSGDNRKKLQAVIDEVSALPRAKRGAILLHKGVYHLSGPIFIKASGIVLRGEGEGANGTVLFSTSTDGSDKNPTTLVQIQGGSADPGATHAIKDSYVPVGARSFFLTSTSGLAVGDSIFVHRPSTKEWIHKLGTDHLPPRADGGKVTQWAPGHFDLDFDRVITAISGGHVTIDAPLSNSLDAKYGGGSVIEYQGHAIEEVGVENLRGDTVYSGKDDESHAWNFITFTNVKNSWAEHVTAAHFAHNAVQVGDGSKWVTVRKSTSLSPISKFEGGRRYAFDISGAQLVLVQGCKSSDGRHDFVTGATTVGPNVFLEGEANSPGSEVGPHQRWATGTLYDNIVVKGGALSAYDRGNMGSGHGWSGANQVFWNSTATSMHCAEPPTAHNWSFGGVAGSRTGDCEWTSFGKHEQPKSLYRAQLADRLGAGALKALDAP